MARKLTEGPHLLLGVHLPRLKITLLAGQLTKVNDGENDRRFLASVMADWTGGLYRLTFLLLAQTETGVTQSATSAKSRAVAPGSIVRKPSDPFRRKTGSAPAAALQRAINAHVGSC